MLTLKLPDSPQKLLLALGCEDKTTSASRLLSNGRLTVKIGAEVKLDLREDKWVSLILSELLQADS
ncbi:hypothetical protein IFO70_22590 [Phormidium tenue FACHB-886]|nr:hypothetical protein [Phormidium tenue FACHB-886]